MVATRFAVAVHLMMLLAGADRPAAHTAAASTSAQSLPATSTRLAALVNTNPVVVRRIAGQLSRAGLIRVHRGPGGAELARGPDAITLDDIWQAVHAASRRPLVPMHPARACAASGGRPGPVRDVLAAAFGDAESSFCAALGRVSLACLVRRSRAGESVLADD